MKTVRKQNTMLILDGRDGNKENIIMAVALVPSENTADCQWFVLHCMKAGVEMADIPFSWIGARLTLSRDLHLVYSYPFAHDI
jgi:hypothetical protein